MYDILIYGRVEEWVLVLNIIALSLVVRFQISLILYLTQRSYFVKTGNNLPLQKDHMKMGILGLQDNRSEARQSEFTHILMGFHGGKSRKFKIFGKYTRTVFPEVIQSFAGSIQPFCQVGMRKKQKEPQQGRELTLHVGVMWVKLSPNR